MSETEIWSRSVGGVLELRSMEDVRVLSRVAEESVGGGNVTYKFNDRFGCLVNLNTNEDVRSMIREWTLCHETFTRVQNRVVPRLEREYIAEQKPALNMVLGLRAEIHLFPPADAEPEVVVANVTDLTTAVAVDPFFLGQ